MTENIQHFRLINGDEIIGDLINQSPEYYYIDNPMVVDDWIDQQAGEGGIVLNRFCTFSRENFVAISYDHVISMVPTDPSVSKFYYESIKYASKSTDRLFKRLEDVADSISESMEPKKPVPYIHKGSKATH